jgi:hypothetical protein
VIFIGCGARAEATSGDRWRVGHRNDIPVVLIESGDHPPSILRIMQDATPPPKPMSS